MMSTTLSVCDLYLKIMYELKEASLVSPPLGAEPFFDPVVKLDTVDDHGRSKKFLLRGLQKCLWRNLMMFPQSIFGQ
jgi:hypothetical protein